MLILKNPFEPFIRISSVNRSNAKQACIAFLNCTSNDRFVELSPQNYKWAVPVCFAGFFTLICYASITLAATTDISSSRTLICFALSIIFEARSATSSFVLNLIISDSHGVSSKD